MFNIYKYIFQYINSMIKIT